MKSSSIFINSWTFPKMWLSYKDFNEKIDRSVQFVPILIISCWSFLTCIAHDVHNISLRHTEFKVHVCFVLVASLQGGIGNILCFWSVINDDRCQFLPANHNENQPIILSVWRIRHPNIALQCNTCLTSDHCTPSLKKQTGSAEQCAAMDTRSTNRC